MWKRYSHETRVLSRVRGKQQREKTPGAFTFLLFLPRSSRIILRILCDLGYICKHGITWQFR